MDTVWQDLRFAARALRNNPAFTLVAVLTLALGIGANSTIFTWVNGFLLSGFPGVPDPDRVVIFSTAYRGNNMSVSYPDFVDFRARNDVLEGLVVMDTQTMSLKLGQEPERIWGLLVSGNYFQALGVRPALGRGFFPEEDRTPNTHPVVVISHTLWQRRFAGDPEIVGRQITLNNHAFTVVGVAPEEFRGTYIALAFDAYVPLMMVDRFATGRSLDHRGNHWLDGLAKLKRGVSLPQAQAQLDVISKQLGEAYPETNHEVVGTLYPLWKSPYGATSVMGPVLLILAGVVGLVLLLACANVANLLLVRAATRRREIAIRLSLGAGRGRLILQLLTECVLLALLGGSAGVVMALWSWDLLLSFLPSLDMPIALQDGLDIRVLGFTLGLSVVTAVVFGLAPALEASRRDVVTALKEEAGALAGGGRKGRLRSSLVVTQVALAVLLLISAGLLLRTLAHVHAVQVGFNPRGVLLASMDLFPSGYTSETGKAFFVQLRERLAAVPGVEAVALARRVPLGFGGSSGTTIEVEGYHPAKDESVFANYNHVSPDYFLAMGMELLRGREFTARDDGNAPLVAVINQAMANRYWAGQDPLGRRFRIGADWFTVIGVVATSKYRQLNEPPRPFFNLTLAQAYRPDVTLHVRSGGDPARLAPAVRAEVQKLDPSLPVFNVTTLEDHIRAATFTQRLGGSLLGAFGALALLLAAVGIYGVISFGVAQRTREIGIRMALGAQRGDILGMVVGNGTRLALAGVAIGLAGAAALSGFLSALLYGVSATDPLTFSGVAVLLAAVALLACYLPARRAARVDPMVALRYE